MFAAYGKNTMRNAKFKFRQPEPAEKRAPQVHPGRERFLRDVDLYRQQILADKERKRKQDEERRRAVIDRIEEARLLGKQVRDGYKPVRVNAMDIIRVTAFEHGISTSELLSHRRARHLVAARDDAIRRVSDARPDLSLPAMGRIFNRDHSTLCHSLKKTSKNGKMRG